MLTCRCDAPRVERELRLSVESPDGRSIRVACTITAETPREITPSSEKPDEYLRVCSWCNKVSVESEWLELADAVETLRLLHGPYHPFLTHGLCDPCAEALESAG